MFVSVIAMAWLASQIVLEMEDEAELERWRHGRKTAAGLHMRAGIILDCAHGDQHSFPS